MPSEKTYSIEDYLEKKYIKEVIEQINNFEFPNNWTPKQVIDYITYKIDRK